MIDQATSFDGLLWIAMPKRRSKILLLKAELAGFMPVKLVSRMKLLLAFSEGATKLLFSAASTLGYLVVDFYEDDVKLC